MKVELIKDPATESRWRIEGDYGRMAGKVEKDKYGVWFDSEQDQAFSAEELIALGEAMKELK